MDKLGQVFRELARANRERKLKNAYAIAELLRKDDGMTDKQIEEMLCADGFGQDVIDEAIQSLPLLKAGKKPKDDGA